MPLLALVALVAPPARGDEAAPGPANVVVLANADLPESLAVAALYAEARGLGADQTCALAMPTDYAIPLATYEATVKAPLAACLEARGLREQALFLAVAWGVPGVIGDAGAEVMGARTKALDAFLADPFDELPGDANPYFHSALAFSRANGFRGYLVTRLDGPGPDVAKDLVRRAVAAELAADATGGMGYFDQEPNGDNAFDRQVIETAGPAGNAAIAHARDLVAAAGFDTVLDQDDAELGTPPALASCSDARWYFGWYRLYHYNDAFQWRPGAVGVHLDSFSAREFRKAGAWVPGALAHGLTASAGAVWEPYLDGFLEGDTFLQAFVVDGVSLAEAAYRAIPRLEWMMVVFGDPLFSLKRTYPGTHLPTEPESTPEPAPERLLEPAPEASAEPVAELCPEPSAEVDVTQLDTTSEASQEPAPDAGSGGCALGRVGRQATVAHFAWLLACAIGVLAARGVSSRTGFMQAGVAPPRPSGRGGVGGEVSCSGSPSQDARAPAASSRRSTPWRCRRCRHSRRTCARRRAPRPCWRVRWR